jgi:hypothetical protein
MVFIEDSSGSLHHYPDMVHLKEPDEESSSFDYLSMIYTIPILAAQASWGAMYAGFPFGGTLGAIMMTVMANDSGDYPFAPIIAAFLSLPVAFLCDIVFYIPCVLMRKEKTL